MKHQINLITVLPYEDGYRPPLTKKYILGKKENITHPKYWKQNIIGWNTLADLYRILKPYIEGKNNDAFYTGIMYGQFEQWGETHYGFRKLKANVKDVAHNYFILDIETANPYPNIANNLKSVRQWLIETYPFITEKTGMILHFSASAGVVKSNGSDDHHQIRVRAIMEHNSAIPLDEAERRNTLRPFMKHNGQGQDFHRHIDNATHQLSRHFYTAPPFLTETQRVIDSDIVCLHEGEPINYDDMRNLDYLSQSNSVRGSQPNAPSDATFVKSVVATNNLIKTKPTEYWWDLIGDGNRWEGHYNLLWSAYTHNQIKKWYEKLINDPFRLGDRTPQSVKSVIAYIEREHTRNFNIDFDVDAHNIIDIPVTLLKDWEDDIVWNDKGVVLQKLYEGAGKTQSLRKLRELYPNKSFLYIAPNTRPIVEACKDLQLDYYEDFKPEIAETDEHGNPKHPFLGICYPSLERIKGETDTRRKNIKWEILVMDEIEQLLIFATDSGGCVRNPSLVDGILRELVEQAELVVGMDARISNLTLQTLEHWRMDKPFDIYTQSKVKPFYDHQCTIVHSLANGVETVVDAIREGKRVAVVSELDCSPNKKEKRNLEMLRRYVQEKTGSKGIAIDRNNASFGIAKALLHDLGDPRLKQRGKIEECLINGTYQHIWFSPIVQSAWSYVSEEAPFDLVVGLYPNRVLTAPNIIQHIKRFRTSKNFVMYIEQNKGIKIRKDVFNKLNPPLAKDEIELSVEQFNARFSLHKRYEGEQLNYRLDHFCEIFEERGGKINFDNRNNIEGRKDLNGFVKEHQEQIIELLKQPKTFNRYLRLSGFEPMDDLL